MQSAWSFVHLQCSHLAAVSGVECDSFAQPWPVDHFRAVLSDEHALCMGVVARDALVAYALGHVEDRSFHLASMAVAPTSRRCGIGEALLRYALGEAARRGCATCTLEVRAGNAAALALYRKLGFAQRKRMERYYDEPREDGLELALCLA